MPQIGLWLVANIFTALLPPIPDDASSDEDRDYYDILGLTRSATNEDIRKAYKVLSLKLHPDKIAQRKETNAEEAARQYELVQEAYGVLINEEKRQRYHALACSPRRYRFVKQGTYANPAALYENLTHARTVDKTRLVVLCTVIILILFIQPILICAKVNQVLEDDGGALVSSSWVALLTPTWIIGAIWILFYATLFALTPMEAKIHVLGSLLETLFWYIGAILFASKLDGSFQGTFAKAMVPVYLAMVTKWISKALILWTIRKDVGRMVTVEYLERQVLRGKSLEELTDEEQENLRKAYLVVTVPPDFVPEPVEETQNVEASEMEEIYEVQKVEASPEYAAAMDIYFTTLGGLVGSLVFGLVFVVLLTLKLDRSLEASYWVVFTPVWIHTGSRLIYYLYQCACGTAMGEEFILHMQQNQGNGENGEGVGEIGTGRPTSSDFVDPNTSVAKFNSNMSAASLDPITEPNLGVTDGSNSNNAVDDKKTAESLTAEPLASDEQGRSGSPNSVPSDEDDEAKISEGKVPKKKKSTESKEEEKTGEAEPEYIHLDEETFHAWQSAYEEAERGAMEQQAKASVECCNLSVQLMLICMVVAKIETGYWDNDTPNDPGFNTFWILFPFFLFFGLVLCCCACLIYGAEPGNASDLTENDGQAPGDQNVQNETQNNEPVIVAAVPPPKVEDEPKSEMASPPEAALEEDVETGGKTTEPEDALLVDMDDLD